MKISLNWLSQYIDLSGLSVDEMSDMLTLPALRWKTSASRAWIPHTWWWPA